MDDSQKWLALIDARNFSSLFVDELGWDRPISEKKQFVFDSEKFELTPVASYKGIQIWSCPALPNARIQREIDKSISNVSAERLLIFHDDTHQNWRWPMSREASGKGIVRLINHEHINGQETLSLIQRLKFIAIPLDEKSPTLVEMLLKLRKAFDAEQITKNFYKEFSSYQKELVNSINGLDRLSDREWYSSLLLNRLMFIYFMQWKGFMDGNQNYLASRLGLIKNLQGPNAFYDFFKDFLLPLFHQGLGAGTKINVPKEIAQIVGKIPYVNGGIFSEHELELKNDIVIPDVAFERIFNFFDGYQWHLDSRRTGNPKEINPDVLGYVFEQFVNNKDQGAYYTKEDITDYMTSNTLLVQLLSRIEKECSINLLLPLVQNCDRYIWPSLVWGLDAQKEYSGESETQNFDKKSPANLGLPGESGWETRQRFRYVNNLRNRILQGNISELSELISLNIDLETLTNDIIDGLDTPEDVVRIWNILSSLKIIDPTCGSGAFLFSALNQLEHIYSVLLDIGEIHEKTARNLELTQIFDEVKKHPNRKYFVLKHAAQKNLFGVDLMKEATEIARLRLFLKLISAIDNFEDIEPLPDLEFNIKSGNLIVGIAHSENLMNYISTLDAISYVEDINNQAGHLADLWENFVSAQDSGYEKARSAKKMLNDGTIILRRTLDKLFYETTSDANKQTFDEWRDTASPFHWFIEFPEVFRSGGFDMVLGNPPYIAKGRVDYNTEGHVTSNCPDIYAICMERAATITREDGAFSMIVMANLVFGERYQSLREFLSKRFSSRFVAGFTKIPASLFEGARVLNVIFIGMNSGKKLYSAPFHRWIQEYRPHLMSTIKYTQLSQKIDESLVWPFVTSPEIANALCGNSGTLRNESLPKGPDYEVIDTQASWDKSQGEMHPLFYKSVAYNRISVFINVPPVEDAQGEASSTTGQRMMWFRNKESRDLAFTLFVSKWMFVWWAMHGDDNNVTQDTLLSFPIDFSSISKKDKNVILKLSSLLHERMTKKIKWKANKRLRIGNWDLSDSGDILHKIDLAWANVLGVPELLPDLQFQYFSTVKTDIFADEVSEEED